MTRIPPAHLARQVAHAAATFEHRLLGRGPTSVSVVAGHDWMVVSLHERLSPVECRIAAASNGAARVRGFHRAVFDGTLEALVEHVNQVTGVTLRGGVVDVDASTGSVLKTFATHPGIDLFLLGEGQPALGVPVNARVQATVAGPAPGSDTPGSHTAGSGLACQTGDPAGRPGGWLPTIGVAEFHANNTHGFDASGGTGAARA
jgi:uncharacterized protein YbcI